MVVFSLPVNLDTNYRFHKRTFLTGSAQFQSESMEEDWNDLAQSEKDEPKLVTQVILIVAVAVMVMVFFLGM